MKKIDRQLRPGDRYKYDFEICTYAEGWAQLDTSQDASYFGTWLNPTLRQTLCYCEGDVTVVTVDTDEELVAEVERIKAWNVEQGHGFGGIDPGFGEVMLHKLEAAGLKNYIHGVENTSTAAETAAKERGWPFGMNAVISEGLKNPTGKDQ
jgi:hypothetical protein